MITYIKDNWIEIVGILASFIILISMLFKTTTYKGTMLMRIFNTIGSFIFILYGICLPAVATAFMNCAVSVVNIFYIVKEYKTHNKVKE